MNINKARGIIILLSFVAVVFSLAFENKIISLALMAVCMLSAVFVLYRHLDKLTNLSDDNPKRKSVRIVTAFNISIFICCVIMAILIGTGVLNPDADGRYFAATIVASVILFGGNISPKLPFSKHTGLRLPWTVTDEKAWVVAHRILGYISIPLALIYIAGVASISNFKIWTLLAVVLWLVIPGTFSYVIHKRNI